jgi:hypothetical protein
MKKTFVLAALFLVLLGTAFAQLRGRQLSADDQQRFDSYFSRWQDYRRTNNRDEMRSMEKRNVAEGGELTPDNRNVLLQHGATRYRQSYTVPSLTREAKLLQASIAECIQRSLDTAEMIYIVPDTIRLMDTIDAMWKVAVRGFIRLAYAEKISERRRSQQVPSARAS